MMVINAWWDEKENKPKSETINITEKEWNKLIEQYKKEAKGK